MELNITHHLQQLMFHKQHQQGRRLVVVIYSGAAARGRWKKENYTVIMSKRQMRQKESFLQYSFLGG
jgi:hypothetical protein